MGALLCSRVMECPQLSAHVFHYRRTQCTLPPPSHQLMKLVGLRVPDPADRAAQCLAGILSSLPLKRGHVHLENVHTLLPVKANLLLTVLADDCPTCFTEGHCVAF